MRKRLLLLAILIPGTTLLGDQMPSQERGFKPDLMYQFNGFDTVTTMNGNLSLAIPLGNAYPVAEGLSYSFVLRYSGYVWEVTEREPRERCSYPKQPPCPDKAIYLPQKDNGGMGWRLSFGALREGSASPPDGSGIYKWMYKTGDASEHYFFDTLHDPPCTTGAICDPVTAGVRYTRDGTYLRMVDAGSNAKVIEFPNGERHRFEKYAEGDPWWRLKWIYNTSSSLVDGIPTPGTHYVKFTYPSQDVWTIEDSHGRSHSVIFTGNRVDKVILAAFGGATAEYDLVYNGADGSTVDGGPRSITRPCMNDGLATSSVHFLTHLLMANVGTSQSPVRDVWKFEYYEGSGSCLDESGHIKNATLPTLGRYEWTWRWYDTDPFSRKFGVSERKRIAVDGTIKERTSYTPTPGRTTISSIDLATGNVDWKTDSYFSVAFDAWQGLPFTTAAVAGITNPDGSAKSRYLSTATYDCNAATDVCSTTPDRVNYVRYEMDAVDVCNIDHPCGRDRNRRPLTERTLYVSDGNRYADADSSDFDGLGHYRKTQTGGNFTSGNARTTETDYNSNTRFWSSSTLTGLSVGTYSVDTSGNRLPGFLMLNASDPWVLNTYTEQKVTEGSTTYVTRTCFDVGNSRVLRKRVQASSGLGANDLLTLYGYDADGNVTDVKSYGGDRQTLSTTNPLCTMTLPSTSVYWSRSSYEHGVPATNEYLDAAGTSLGFFASDLTIDPNTGFVQQSRDTAGVVTTYTYDAAGRLTSIAPTGGASIALTYARAQSAPFRPASVTQTVTSSTGSVETIYRYDSLGRLWHEVMAMPGGKWSLRETLYDGFGRKASVSEWVDIPPGSDELELSPSAKTSFLYDLYGRVTAAIVPDASRTDTVYAGDRYKTRTFKVWTGADTAVSVTEEFDRLGRLIEVRERSGPSTSVDADGWVRTSYEYDAGGRLTTAKMFGTEESQPVQQRLFKYDGRGFLESEDHPETAEVSYEYDARGHVTSKSLAGSPTPHDLQFKYDRAERLEFVQERTPTSLGTYRNQKEYQYGTANLSLPPIGQEPARTSLVKGKLHTATRWNYPPGPPTVSDPAVRVAETYEYADTAGRKTARDTEIAADYSGDGEYNEAKTVRQRMTYNDLGLPERTYYPKCLACGFPSDWTNLAYAMGRVVGLDVDGPFSSVPVTAGSVLALSPAGVVTKYSHLNGMEDATTLDVMSRPKRVQSGAWSVCTQPSATITPASQTINSGETVTLSATAAGTQPISYQWWSRTGTGTWTFIDGATSSTYPAAPSTTTSYMVEVENDCGRAEANMTLTVNACVAPVIETETVDGLDASVAPLSRIISPGSSLTLAVTASGSGTLSYSWYRNGDMSAPVATTPTFPTPALTATTSYFCVVQGSCGQVQSSTVVFVVPLPQPAALTASRDSSGAILLQWGPSAGAHHYRIERMSQGGEFAAIGETSGTATSYTDNSVSVGTTYVYRVLAHDAAHSSESAASNRDLATTMTFTAISAGMRPDDSHFAELLTALNALNAANGWAAVTWTSILPAGVSVPGGSGPIRSEHVATLRARMNAALSALGVAVTSDPDDPVTGGVTRIRAAHLTTLQQKVQ